ncbi:glucose-6-phosphate dehydrogenase [Alkalihalobacillus sp. MEB130]|uniref:glucose-6-phosphate dehydrogenase n=1 Tax=Alkalihalobacillus sp. MEB130 TaxID=2976704 RepID=UPI0028DE0819|nr:glucose-6-phosphate dehydrogenase [Alkalihalobacillus sp. MEB130]MDT8859721.1 glucose-6-phosphate dehydrogenase [Alkalihalobacillus sp. MEB130]
MSKVIMANEYHEMSKPLDETMDPMTFILFGATGDLAKRKIFPALYNLFLDNRLPSCFLVIGLGRRQWTNKMFRELVLKSLQTFSRRVMDDSKRTEEFLNLFTYYVFNAKGTDDYEYLHKRVMYLEEELRLPQNRLYYLSVAPDLVADITLKIKKSGLKSTKGWNRIILEKPFGYDLESAQKLHESLRYLFSENEIYRIDHYLGKPMVQKLETLDLGNPIFRELVNNYSIANVQITASETVGVEDRAAYYDEAGAIRDMVQNHLLQLVMMTAFHLEQKITNKHLDGEKATIIKFLRQMDKSEVKRNVIRGQYVSGHVLHEQVIGYQDEPGVEKLSQNDTFIAARLWIDNNFWAGIPFYIRTGKRMKEKSTKIVVEFSSKAMGGKSEGQFPNILTIAINPEEKISLQLNMMNPISKQSEPVSIDFSAESEMEREAYELLIYDAIKGRSTFFAKWEEVEWSWKWVQPILEAFCDGDVPLYPYQAGSMGPEEADKLMKEDQMYWGDNEVY